MGIKQISSKTHVDECGFLSFDVQLEMEDGSIAEKRLSADDYVKLFTESSKRPKEVYTEVPRLPKEVIWAAVGDHPDTFKAVVVLPAATRPVCHLRQVFDKVPFPTLCAKIDVRDGKKYDMRLFALKNEGENAELYAFPFGNVSSDGGWCCFGNIVVEGVKNVSEYAKVTDAFLTGESNSDLWHGGENAKKYRTQGDLLEGIRGKNKFPVTLLAKSRGKVRDLCTVN